MISNTPQELLGALIQAYYYDRDIETILSCVTDGIEWIGTENNDSARGKEALKQLLEKDLEDFPDVIQIELDETYVQEIVPNAATASVTGKQLAIPGVNTEFFIRGTAFCVKEDDGWHASCVHMSVPNAELENHFLRSELDTEKEKQTALLENVPGGVAMYRIKKEGRIATDYVSDGLAKICGYEDSKDIMRVMEYDSRKLVLPEDFPVIGAACKESLEKGVPTSVNYRVYGKDGNPVRITLDAVVMKNAVLEEDDAAVFYAVQTLVSEKANKEIEEQKILMDMMDTAPAGLGIYEMIDGVVKQTYMNDAFYDMIGSTREKRSHFAGVNAMLSAHPNDAPKIIDLFHKMMAGEDNMQLDYRMKNDEDQWIWIHARCTLSERREDYVRLYIAFYECTEEKKRQLQIEENQYAVELAQQQGDMAIWTYNIDQQVIIQQTPLDVEGHMGYPVYIKNVPQSFIENNSVHPEDIDKFLDTYKKLAEGAENADALYRLVNQNTGKYNWVHMYYRTMKNTENSDRLAVGFSMNADAQQEAVERYLLEVKLREQMYSDAVVYVEYDLTNDCFIGKKTMDAVYEQKRWEGSTEEGYSENLYFAVDDAYQNEVTEKLYSQNLLKAFQNGESQISCEYRSKDRPGMPATWYHTTVIMIKRPDTGAVISFTYVINIEKEKQRQLAIESSMSDGIENIAIIQVKDGQSRLIRSNEEIRLKNVDKEFVYDEDFVDRSHVFVVPAEKEFSYQAALLPTVVKELEQQDIYQYSVSMKGKDGKLRRQLFRFRYLDDRKVSIVLSISDITAVYLEEQEKKQELLNALREAKEASSAKAQFYSRMSHDMRTPMNGILGMTELSGDEEDVHKLKENMRKIRESGEYLLSLVNDTLDLQRIESGKMVLEPKIVSTVDVVNNILDMVRVTAEAKGVNLKYSAGNADLNWYVRIDALRMKQIFVNLLSNAIKFTPEGGTVEFSFQLIRREGMISHDVVYVKDTGVGMSEDFLRNGIFKPFSQESNAVSAKYAGSGLGLSIARSLVELMGGKIKVESEVGVGTTFAVYLDFERVERAEAEKLLNEKKKQKEGITVSLKGKKILLAEDHPLNAEIAKKLLEKAGCEVTWMQNGQETVNCIANASENSFDAILMDIRMPVMDGLEAARQIRALNKEGCSTVPIIAMTANAYEEDMRASLEAGMNVHLGKPIEPKALYEAIISVCQCGG